MVQKPAAGRKFSWAMAILAFAGMGYVGSEAFAGDTEYKYDPHGRVIEVIYPDNTRITYAYDQAGNRTQVVAALNAASSSSSGGTNVAPVCTAQTNTISGIPSNIDVTITIAATQITNLCTDANGDALTVTVPATIPVKFNLPAATTVNTSYTVSDGRSPALTDSDVVTYTRP